jgi:hypothetical protein
MYVISNVNEVLKKDNIVLETNLTAKLKFFYLFEMLFLFWFSSNYEFQNILTCECKKHPRKIVNKKNYFTFGMMQCLSVVYWSLLVENVIRLK